MPATFSLIGIAYNEEMVTTPPTAWEDLWNEEYAGIRGICRTSSNLGLGTLAITSKIFGRLGVQPRARLGKAEGARPDRGAGARASSPR